MKTFSSLGDLLLKRYTQDFIKAMQAMPSPILGHIRKEPMREIWSTEDKLWTLTVDGEGLCWIQHPCPEEINLEYHGPWRFGPEDDRSFLSYHKCKALPPGAMVTQMLLSWVGK